MNTPTIKVKILFLLVYSYKEFVEITALEINMMPKRDIENRIMENRAAGRSRRADQTNRIPGQ